MSLDNAAVESLQHHLVQAFEAQRVVVTSRHQLSGGAIQENWAIDLDVSGGPRAGNHALVLRTDSPSGVAVSLSRAEEFELLKAAWESGVTVPEPIYCCTDTTVLGKQFCLMGRVAGTALGQKVVKDQSLGGDREVLTKRLGAELARIHTITPRTHRFAFLSIPDETPALHELHTLRAHLDALGRARPVLEWTMRWLELRAPHSDGIVLAHHDFRTGNYMVDNEGLTAILDWEFAGWSDPHEDIGWFCAMCWRFSGRDREAGGIGSRAAFYRGYLDQGGGRIDPAKVYWWEVYAHLRWAVIALQQGERYLTGGEKTLHLGMTALIATELEVEMLKLTTPGIELPSEAA
jgi:aminoglycoside phosphotransferase (APT) family kinase protein